MTKDLQKLGRVLYFVNNMCRVQLNMQCLFKLKRLIPSQNTQYMGLCKFCYKSFILYPHQAHVQEGSARGTNKTPPSLSENHIMEYYCIH